MLLQVYYISNIAIAGELYTNDDDPPTLVAVKVLKDGVTNEVRKDFEREVEIMCSFDHDNILKLIGIVVEGKIWSVT